MMGIDLQTQPVTGTGAMSYSFAPGKEFTFEEVRLHLSDALAPAENFVITLVSGKGSLYNVILYSKDMNLVQDLVYQPEQPHNFDPADSLTFAWTNTNGKTWGMEIVYKASQ